MTKIRMALTAVVAVGLAALAAGQVPADAASAQMTPLPSIAHAAPADGGLLLKIDYDDHCRRWRHECADRWGWRTHRFFICLRRHDCG